MLTHLEIGNFKAFGPVQSIQLAPLTILVGPNSGGKSSILQALIYARHAALSGDLNATVVQTDYEAVDLGGFRQFIHKRDRAPLTLGFSIPISQIGAEVPSALRGHETLQVRYVLRWAPVWGIPSGEWASANTPLVSSLSVSLDSIPLFHAEKHNPSVLCDIQEINEVSLSLSVEWDHPSMKRHLAPTHLAGEGTARARRRPGAGPVSPETRAACEAVQNRYEVHMIGLQPDMRERDPECPWRGSPPSPPIVSVAAGDPGGTASERAGVAIWELDRAMQWATGRIRKELSALTHLGPLRAIPRRNEEVALQSAPTAPASRAWGTMAQRSELREKANEWLGRPSRLGSPYRLSLRLRGEFTDLGALIRSAVRSAAEALLEVRPCPIEEINDLARSLGERLEDIEDRLERLVPRAYWDKLVGYPWAGERPAALKWLAEHPHEEEVWSKVLQAIRPFLLAARSSARHDMSEKLRAGGYWQWDEERDLAVRTALKPYIGFLDDWGQIEDRLSQLRDSQENDIPMLQEINEGRAERAVKNSGATLQLLEGFGAARGGHHFDFGARVLLEDIRTGTEVAPCDVGVGISQVLPVLVECMASEGRLILIEQPELHLHPKLQADVADVLLDAAVRKGSRPNQIVAETHSEELILRIMRRIRETTRGTLPKGASPVAPCDVAVLYVHPCDDGTSRVLPLRVDEGGEFIDPWPGGFFEEAFAERFPELAGESSPGRSQPLASADAAPPHPRGDADAPRSPDAPAPRAEPRKSDSAPRSGKRRAQEKARPTKVIPETAPTSTKKRTRR